MLQINTKPGFNHTGNVLLHLALLRSYEHMGFASVTCESGGHACMRVLCSILHCRGDLMYCCLVA